MFQLEEIFLDKKYVHETLGITKERKRELRLSVEHALVEYDSQLEAAQVYLKECKHMNEVYWCIYHASMFMQKLKRVIS
jgi:hypothetical protein